MIRNNFIYEIDFEFDVSKVNLNQGSTTGLLSHQRLVKDNPYMVNIHNRYNFLSDRFNIYTLNPKSSWRIHIDAKRNAALNIPIENSACARTDFYESVDNDSLELVLEKAFYVLKKEPKKIYSFFLQKPTIINTSIPHNVTNLSDNTRIILSWSIVDRYSYSDVIKYW